MCKIAIPPGHARHESRRNLKHSIKETPGIRTMRCSKVRLFFSPGALLRCCCFTFLSGQGTSLEVLVGLNLHAKKYHKNPSLSQKSNATSKALNLFHLLLFIQFCTNFVQQGEVQTLHQMRMLQVTSRKSTPNGKGGKKMANFKKLEHEIRLKMYRKNPRNIVFFLGGGEILK